MEKSAPKPKVYIIEEKAYQTQEAPPPNYFPWFSCVKAWDRIPEDQKGYL